MATFGDIPRLKCRPHAPQDSVLYATAVLAPRGTRSPKGFPRCRTLRFNVARLPAAPTRPSRGLGSPSGFVVPAGHRLLRPHPPLWTPLRRLWIRGGGCCTQGCRLGVGIQRFPQFTPVDCARVSPPLPRWPRRVPMTVASSPVLAFISRLEVRRSRWSFRGCRVRSELKFVLILRPASWLALLTRTFTFELALAGSPRASVEYDYVGKQSTPTTGLSPASPTALWAAEPGPTPRSRPRPREVATGVGAGSRA